MWYGHIRDLFTTAEGCMGSRLPNATMLHWAQQRYALVGSDVLLCVVVNSTRAHFSFPALKNTTKIQREDTQRDRKRAKRWRERSKKERPGIRTNNNHNHNHTNTARSGVVVKPRISVAPKRWEGGGAKGPEGWGPEGWTPWGLAPSPGV